MHSYKIAYLDKVANDKIPKKIAKTIKIAIEKRLMTKGSSQNNFPNF
jgi:hypothetical protein